MKRIHPLTTVVSISQQEQIAFHEAGHAAAIHLYNKQQSLPSVFFQIRVKPQSALVADAWLHDRFAAGVEGGYLIDNLPVTLIESASYFAPAGLDAYRAAFEADMVNLLVGALAEAKQVAVRAGRSFNLDQPHISTLRCYGGSSDVLKVYSYLERFIASRTQRENKFADLLTKALNFIDNGQHWQAISRLAAYLLACDQDTVSCEQAIAVLDGHSLAG